MSPKIDLGPKSDRDILILAAEGVNELNEKVDNIVRVVDSHGLAISANTQALGLQKARCDGVQNCPPNGNGFDRRLIITTGGLSAAGGGVIVALLSEIFKSIFGK